jgi:hypothetical protein
MFHRNQESLISGNEIAEGDLRNMRLQRSCIPQTPGT